MSAKEGDDDNEAYVEDEYVEDDDDDEEDDFHPGGDDDDDEDDEEEDEYDDEEDQNDEALYLDGTLSYDVKGQKLHYQGHGFRLESTDPVTFNLLDKKASTLLLLPDHSFTTTMVGPCDVVVTEAAESSSRRKPTPRKIKVTCTVADSNHVNTAPRNLKKTGDDDDDDPDDEEEKEEAKKPSLYYQIYGSEMDNPEHGIEFTGGFAPEGSNSDSHHEIRLLCQVRRSNPPAVTTISSSSGSTAVTSATAAVAVARRRNHENDDDDDNMGDVVDDDGIDHNELIALHEDAMLSTEALRKRYRGPSLDETREDHEHETKKPKSHGNKNDDDDDDDDIEF